jgi:hypothetical protein
MKLSSFQRSLIVDAINDVFFRLEARLLGRWFKGPTIYFSVVSEVDPGETLEGVYRYALSMLYGPAASIDEKHLKELHEIAQNYLEAERLRRVNKVLTDTAAAEDAAAAAASLQENIDKATSYINTLMVTEARNMQAYAERDGIIKLAASIGVDDPVVVKLGIVDDRLCKACRTLWHDRSNISKPRPWKMSELRDGYNKSQLDPTPTLNATHPHCRHVLSFVPPNFGFDDKGMIKFIAFGYDYYEDYHGTHKVELIDENLLKSCTCL